MKHLTYIFTISIMLVFFSCTKRESNAEPDLIFKSNPAPLVHDGWRKMGDFFNDKCSPVYLFTLGTKAYFFIYGSSKLTSNFWQYDPVSNEFSPQAAIPGKYETGYVDFTNISFNAAIGAKGYVAVTWKEPPYLTGTKTVYAYDPSTNNWDQKADLFADTLSRPVIMVIGSKAYSCGWQMPNGYKDTETYSYDPASDRWTNTNASFSFSWISRIGFTANDKGYMVSRNLSTDSLQTNEYDASNNTWRIVTDFPIQTPPVGGGRTIAYSYYTRENKGYLYCGKLDYNTQLLDNRIFEFSPTTKKWTQLKDFDGPARPLSVTFSIGNKAYISFGNSYHDVWEYNP